MMKGNSNENDFEFEINSIVEIHMRNKR